jgi:hypothetical protein
MYITIQHSPEGYYLVSILQLSIKVRILSKMLETRNGVPMQLCNCLAPGIK